MANAQRKCTAEDFESAKHRVSLGNQEYVRRILVDGESQSKVAAEAGVSQPFLSKLSKRVLAEIQSKRLSDPKWESETFVAPRVVLDKLRDTLETLLEQHNMGLAVNDLESSLRKG